MGTCGEVGRGASTGVGADSTARSACGSAVVAVGRCCGTTRRRREHRDCCSCLGLLLRTSSASFVLSLGNSLSSEALDSSDHRDSSLAHNHLHTSASR